jgi:hypothetical protein
MNIDTNTDIFRILNKNIIYHLMFEKVWHFVVEFWKQDGAGRSGSNPFESRVSAGHEWGETDLSGPKLKNPDPIHVGPLRIRPSRVGTGEPRGGVGGSWQVRQVRFFFAISKKAKKILNVAPPWSVVQCCEKLWKLLFSLMNHQINFKFHKKLWKLLFYK